MQSHVGEAPRESACGLKGEEYETTSRPACKAMAGGSDDSGPFRLWESAAGGIGVPGNRQLDVRDRRRDRHNVSGAFTVCGLFVEGIGGSVQRTGLRSSMA